MSARLSLEEAVAALARGEVVCVPTDTVYGLAVRADHPDGCARVFALKGRPDSFALPVLVATLADALELCHESQRGVLAQLGTALWPGPLSIVVRRAVGIGYSLGGDEETIGLRVPAHEATFALLSRSGPLAVSSANRHGRSPCTSVEELEEAFGDAVGVLDGGRCDGAPSTVVTILEDPPRLFREGPVTLDDVTTALASS